MNHNKIKASEKGEDEAPRNDVEGMTKTDAYTKVETDSYQITKTDSYKMSKIDSYKMEKLDKTDSYKLANKRNREKQAIASQRAIVRDDDEAKPMGWDDRLLLNVKKKLGLDDASANSSVGSIEGNDNLLRRIARHNRHHSSVSNISELEEDYRDATFQQHQHKLDGRDLSSTNVAFTDEESGHGTFKKDTATKTPPTSSSSANPINIDEMKVEASKSSIEQVDTIENIGSTGSNGDGLNCRFKYSIGRQTVPDNRRRRNKITNLIDKMLGRQNSSKQLADRDLMTRKKNDNSNKIDDDHPDIANKHDFLLDSKAGLSDSPLNHNDMNTMTPSGTLRRFFHWTFRVYFVVLLWLMFFGFCACVTFFALLLMIAGSFDPACIRIMGEPYGSVGAHFSDAFVLSWTTFSTVGFGTAAVALGFQNTNGLNCAVVTTICSLEALSGTLFTGVCGAILFGKVLRILSHAQVVFSDPILIRYGEGVREIDAESDDFKQLPFPVLEFRIINRLHDEDGGEIVDALVQVVAKIDHEDKLADSLRLSSLDLDNDDSERGINKSSHAEDSIHPSVLNIGKLWIDKMRHRQNSKQMLSRSWHGNIQHSFGDESVNTASSNIHSNEADSHNKRTNSSSKNVNSQFFEDNNHQGTVSKDERPRRMQRTISQQSMSWISTRSKEQLTGRNAASTAGSSHPVSRNQLYYKIDIEAPDHPFFKRVWVVRHTLNDKSPIVKQRVKMAIKRNNGCWPYNKLNTYDSIKQSLHFNHIIVSLSGVSNVSASTVFAQKIYEFEDVNVGYQFANVLYRDSDNGILKVDLDLINDVRVQRGGGNEPLLGESDEDEMEIDTCTAKNAQE